MYIKKEKLDDYLYLLEYDNIDYKYAYLDSSFGGCTSFRLGNYFGRNYDWLYDWSETFIVKTKNVIGVAGNIPELTKQFVEDTDNDNSEWYERLPFALLDGINRSGLVVSMNVVPLDYGSNISQPKIELRHSLCSKVVPRFLLNRFSNAIDAVNYLRDYCSIYCTKTLKEKGYEIHFIISDSYNNTFVVELINNKLNIINHNAITNFHISGVKFNSDKKVFTPATQMINTNAMSYNHVTKYGCGLERYNLVKSLNCFKKENIKQLLKDLRYSNAYTQLNWFTEFVGNELTTSSSVKDYIKVLAPIMDDLEYKSRDDSKLWQTVHSSLYDIPNKTLELCVQENFDKVWTFNV